MKRMWNLIVASTFLLIFGYTFEVSAKNNDMVNLKVEVLVDQKNVAQLDMTVQPGAENTNSSESVNGYSYTLEYKANRLGKNAWEIAGTFTQVKNGTKQTPVPFSLQTTENIKGVSKYSKGDKTNPLAQSFEINIVPKTVKN